MNKREEIRIKRIGEENTNNQGLRMWICDYRKRNDIDVEFENGYIAKNRQYIDFLRGEIKNILHPTLFKNGFIGDKNYNYKSNSALYWRSMLQRCYSKKAHKKHPTYINCEVCEQWLCYSNFKEWFDKSYYEVENEKMHLDKDILVKGNKIYSPETAIFVPEKINELFSKRNKNNNHNKNLPVGVTLTEANRFRARCHRKNSSVHLGCFDTAEEAFMAYKNFKENYIKEVADEYKDKIPKKLYDALYRIEVNIYD